MRRFLSFLCIFLSLTTAAQTSKVRGTVRDAETGEPIPFASVYFDGTVIGISTDLEGRYSLETRSDDITTLTAHLIGYEAETRQIAKGSFSEVDFVLKKDLRQLEAALVRPDNRYIRSILDRLDRARKRHDPELADAWQTRLYSKIELDATEAENIIEKSFLKRHLDFVMDYRDTSAVTGKSYIPIMISEAVSRKYHSLNPDVDKEIIEASRISGLEQDNILRQFTGSYLLETNFYRGQITVFNLDVPSPASALGHAFYNYYLVDSLQVEGRKTYTLRFHPKALVTSPVLDGEMNVDAEDFAIRSVHASLAAQSNVNWIRHINVDIENRRLDDGRWFPGEERLFIDFSISTNDNSKVIFYFTADGRVDFRELVKDLAGVFKMRIELRQIGVRDETKMMGGIGSCGRELCCHAWLPDFEPVSIKMAKVQNLSLNPIKISGICGRLMCCLQYENETYCHLKKGMPDVGERITTRDGKAVVTDVNILENKIKTRLILEEKTEDKPEKLSTEYYIYGKEEIQRAPNKRGQDKNFPKKAKKKGGFGTDADIAAMSEEELKQQAELLELE